MEKFNCGFEKHFIQKSQLHIECAFHSVTLLLVSENSPEHRADAPTEGLPGTAWVFD